MIRRPPRSTLFPLHDALPISFRRTSMLSGNSSCSASPYPYKTSERPSDSSYSQNQIEPAQRVFCSERRVQSHSRCRDRKSTRLNSSHLVISYAVFCLKTKPSLPGLAGRLQLGQAMLQGRRVGRVLHPGLDDLARLRPFADLLVVVAHLRIRLPVVWIQ